jgi:hypothetical protein
LALPIGFACILLGIKAALDTGSSNLEKVTVPALIQNDTNTMIILSFSDYVSAILAKRVCVPESSGTGEFEISGMPNQGANWQVPFVKCDFRQCEYEGQEAYDFCEYNYLAVAPQSSDDAGGLERALAFKDYVYERYPQLLSWLERRGSTTTDFVTMFDSTEDIDTWVTDPSYGCCGKIALAVVFEGNDPDDYQYSIRVNSTNFNNPFDAAQPAAATTPDTKTITATFANEDKVCDLPGAPDQGPLSKSCTGLYIYNGFLTTQRLVQDWILKNATNDTVFVSEHGVRCRFTVTMRPTR